MTDEIEVARRAFKKVKNGFGAKELTLDELGALYVYHPEVLSDVSRGESEV